jgi:Putative papain-like cysteine peptidase (DUF1796)
MKYDRFISLGCDCQAAYNIRRVTGDLSPFFFDWLYTPLYGLMDTLETDFAHVLQKENVTYSVNFISRTVTDSRSGLDFFHFFSKDPDGGVNENAIEREYRIQKTKFDFLASRWLRMVKDARILFVRHTSKIGNPESIDDLKRLRELLLRKYPSVDCTILAVTRRNLTLDRPLEPPLENCAGIFTTSVKNAKWPGDAPSWDAALTFFK